MKVSYLALFLVLVLLSSVNVSMAATCSAVQLSSCWGAITSGSPPSSECCGKLKSQQPCLCQYIRDPNLRQYVNSPNARKLAAACGVPFPRC
ncbi:hypothetical protein ACHQM5_009581 [Ranunculus cassubicifolius]